MVHQGAILGRARLAAMVGGIALAVPVPAWSIDIVTTMTGFSATQQQVIQRAAQQWELLVGGTDQIALNITADNTIAPLASTSGWALGANGRPTAVNISIRENAHSWTLGAPVAGIDDALDTMTHEIGHAIGFAAGAFPNFQANVQTTAGGQRYYDVDRNGSFAAAIDFALGPVGAGTHTPVSSGDLMAPSTPAGNRNTPNLRHAAVLTDALAYDVILSGLGGTSGYGTRAMTPNDDSSSSLLNLPFGLNFYGSTYNNFYVNNNGNITFNGPVSTYTPNPFPIANQPMIAPFWGDVDTRCATCGAVYVASPDANTVVVTWDHVGYYNQRSNLTNTFQMVLRNRPDATVGDFDAEFRYGSLNWTTGEASGGVNGLGGTPAQAGLDAGDSTNFFTLPGSRSGAVLDLEDTTNLTSPIPGVWSLAVRSGLPPGSSSSNPLLPVVTSNGWNFNFNVGPNTGRVFIDPVIAIGYDYILNAGPNFATVLLPTGVGDDIYDLWLFDSGLGQFVDSGIDIMGGVSYDFGGGGINRFSIRGIEVAEALDPTDFTAFVTGITFAGTGLVDMTMIPVTFDTNAGGAVPSPASLPLVLLALAGMGLAGRRRAIPLH